MKKNKMPWYKKRGYQWLVALLVLGAMGTRYYMSTHRTYLYLNVFLVRDMNGRIVRRRADFYTKGQKQKCSPGIYWP